MRLTDSEYTIVVAHAKSFSIESIARQSRLSFSLHIKAGTTVECLKSAQCDCKTRRADFDYLNLLQHKK